MINAIQKVTELNTAESKCIPLFDGPLRVLELVPWLLTWAGEGAGQKCSTPNSILSCIGKNMMVINVSLRGAKR